ncbi:MAG: deoxyhypusine synthase family protein [Candidatus Thermoplasmatota archaeon]|nr:deoxyhypusine synthase family protein [Candidatus Thermoplasmatota archaeon]
MRDFVDRHFRHFNAGELRRCSESLSDFVENGGRLMITLAGAMSTAEIGRSLAPAIREGKVHAICCTGANLEEDLFQLIAASHYGDIPNWRDLSPSEESQLKNRITNRTIPEEKAIRKVESQLVSLWKESAGKLPHEFLYELIKKVDADADPRDSWLLAAAECDLPLFVPGWEDSTLGNIFAARVIDGTVDVDAILGGTHYMLSLVDWIREHHSNGFLQVGGGIAGDFPICVVPMLRQDLGEEVPLWAWFAQISESHPSYGGYSGAPPNEKISWEKLGVDTPKFVIESDATIVLPILLSYLLNE